MVGNQPNPEEPEGGDLQGPIEGGAVEHTDRPDIKVQGPFDVEKHRGLLTVYLVALLGLTIVGHYAGLILLVWNGKNVEALSNAYHVALPVVSGLTGSAFAYYFTRKNVE
jgi:hypothetical protein